MPDASKTRSKLSLIIFLLIIQVFAVFLLLSEKRLADVIDKEFTLIERQVGREESLNVYERANRWYIKTTIDSGFQHTVYDFLIGHWDADSGRELIDDRGLSAWFERRLATTWLAIYLVHFRLSGITLWLPYFLPLIFPMIVDGLSQRQIKKHQFSFTSPVIHTNAARGFLVLLALILFIPIIPISIPPLIIPFALFFSCLCAWVYAAHMIKRI